MFYVNPAWFSSVLLIETAIQGATKLTASATALSNAAQEKFKALPEGDAKKNATLKANSFKAQMEYAEPLAKALKAALLARGSAHFDSDAKPSPRASRCAARSSTTSR